jgi:hypothetical protein
MLLKIKVLIFFLFFPVFLNSQQLNELKIIPFNAGEYDEFGWHVNLNDSLLFVASKNKNNYAGVIYIYKKSNSEWKFYDTLVTSDLNEFDRLASVTLSGDNLFITAVSKEVNGIQQVGAVYYFESENNKWIEKQKIVPDTAELQLNFGFRISISNDYLIVGAPGSNEFASRAGKVFLYKKYNKEYKLYQTFIPRNPQPYQRFGSELIITTDFILIGSPNYSTASGDYSGKVDYFEKEDSLWVWKKEILPSPSSEYAFFGGAMATGKNYLCITAMGSINGSVEGSAYIYEYAGNDIREIQIIRAGNNQLSNYFGYDVAMNNDSLIISALSDITDGRFVGAVYLFKNIMGEWEMEKRIVPNDLMTAHRFGNSVAFKNGFIAIGAPQSTVNNIFSGAAFIYSDSTLTYIYKDEDNVEMNFHLSQNYPNPFNSSSLITYAIHKEGLVTLKIYDLLGREIEEVVREIHSPGSYKTRFDAKNLASGVYYYSLMFGNENITKKFIVLK